MRWKGRYRCAVTISVDFDAETLWSGTFKLTTPSPLSRGDYDIRAGIPRIHALLDKHEIPATFMVPGQVDRRSPRRLPRDRRPRRPRSAITATTTRACSTSPIEEERELMKRGIGRIEEMFGTKPRGNRSPPFALGPNTADLLEEFGFAYDSSLFGHDEPYRPRVPVLGGELRDFVELPVSWELDDAPYFLFNFFPYMSGLRDAVAGARDLEGGVRRLVRGRRLLPARRPPVLHRPTPAHRDARRAAHLHHGP